MSYSYGARKKCGCLVAVASGEADFSKEAAKYVARWIREGLEIERVSDETIRRDFGPCIHNKQLELTDKV